MLFGGWRRTRHPLWDGLSAERSHFSAKQRRFSADQGLFSAEQSHFSAEQNRLSAEQGLFSAEQGLFSADERRFSTEHSLFPADQHVPDAVPEMPISRDRLINSLAPEGASPPIRPCKPRSNN